MNEVEHLFIYVSHLHLHLKNFMFKYFWPIFFWANGLFYREGRSPTKSIQSGMAVTESGDGEASP